MTQLITDVNEFEISEGDRVEYLGMDDRAGELGKVDYVVRVNGAIMVCVEFDSEPGQTYEIPPRHLAVVHVEPCATGLLTDPEYLLAVGRY